jgi:hypothetical protein
VRQKGRGDGQAGAVAALSDRHLEEHKPVLDRFQEKATEDQARAEHAESARELYDEMLKLHPLRMNVNALWRSVLAIMG